MRAQNLLHVAGILSQLNQPQEHNDFEPCLKKALVLEFRGRGLRWMWQPLKSLEDGWLSRQGVRRALLEH